MLTIAYPRDALPLLYAGGAPSFAHPAVFRAPGVGSARLSLGTIGVVASAIHGSHLGDEAS